MARIGWLGHVPWTSLAVSAAVILSSGFAVTPVREAATNADVADAFLMRPLSYVAIAPLSNVLDTMTLLSLRQHIALMAAAVVLFVLWRTATAWWSSRKPEPSSDSRAPSWRGHLIASVILIAVIAITYVAAAVLPRPMAALVVNNANLVRVDFHSHTSASHDGRSGWNAERNRAWHEAAGYDVAYVTDHASITEAERGMAPNPHPVGEGVTLLQGIEVTWTGEHVAILGAERTYRGLLTENLRDVDVEALTLASSIRGREPVVVWNHPHDLDRLPIASGPGTAGVRAVEIVNGAPDDIDEMRSKRREIVALAEQRNLALTTGSDNHGWGRAAPGWTLMRIPGWRAVDPDALANHIEAAIRTAGFHSTIVVERRVADPGSSAIALALTFIVVPARMLTTLSNNERVAWLLWIWLSAGTVWWIRRTAGSRRAA